MELELTTPPPPPQAAARGGIGGGLGGGGASEEEKAEMEANFAVQLAESRNKGEKAEMEAKYAVQLAEMDLVLKSQFSEQMACMFYIVKNMHARLAKEREAERLHLLEEQASEKEKMLAGQDAQRKAVLASGTRDWVKIILQLLRASDKLNEQLSFTSVLKAAVQTEIGSFARTESAQADAAEGEGLDEAQRKILLDQILIKLKNFKEESGKALKLMDDVSGTALV
ncbi:hypothetical protein T492DRAFT_1140440 [Pavlovales sp. CCMP2436]|nr:hypothetical protein T492DRAFT_1140440 [Pavlovales sp. CCMP2436]